MNKTLNQRIYEVPGDIKKAIYDSGKLAAAEQIFADLEAFHAVGDYKEFYVLTEEAVNKLKKKYGVK